MPRHVKNTLKMTRDVIKPSAAAALWHSVWRLAAPSGEGRRIWRALAMIAAVEASSRSSKSSGRAARAGDLVVLGPALDPRVRVVLEVVPSGALETEMSEWLKEHDWKSTPPARADAQEIPPTHLRSNGFHNMDVRRRVPVNDGVAPGFRGVCDTVLTQKLISFPVVISSTSGYVWGW